MNANKLFLIIALLMLIPTSAFALVETIGGAAPAVEVTTAPSAHDCLVIVIDGSGSMDEGMPDGRGHEVRKMDAAKMALKSVIDQIPPNTHVGVLLFVGSNFREQIGWITQIGPINKPQLKAAIDQIEPGGGTPLGQSIKLGADALLDAREAQMNYGNYQLLVVTDGEATDSDLMNAYAPEVVKPERHIQFDVIGVNMPGRHMLANMANRYWGANDTIALNSALKTAVQAETASASAAQEDYALLSGLPDDVAKAWLSSVATSHFANWHIGEQPPPPKPTGGAAQASNSAAQNTPQANPQKDPGLPTFLIVIFAVCGVIVVLGFLAKIFD